jgi:hypothetical protein
MKTFFTTLAAILVASSVIGMGTQGALYEGAEDLISYMTAWNKECSGKTDADCSRNLAAVRKEAYKNAQWIQELFEQTDNDSHWLIYVQLFKYHGDCFDRYDTQGCKDEWTAFVKEKSRIENLYGPEPRWSHFPEALKGRRLANPK